jgi:hypothetical protein
MPALQSFELNEGLCGLDCALDDVSGFVNRVINLTFCAFDCLLGFVTEALRLSLQIVSGIFKVITSVFSSLAKLLAGLGAGLWSVEESDCGSCADANAEGEPIILCTHSKYLVKEFASQFFCFSRCAFLTDWIRLHRDWLVFLANSKAGNGVKGILSGNGCSSSGSFVHPKNHAGSGYSDLEVMRERHFDDDRLRCNDRGAGVRSFERVCRKESSLDSQASQFPCPQKNLREHRAVQAARVGVA